MSETYDQMVSSIQFIQEDLKEAVNAAQTGEDFIRDGEELDPTEYIAQQPYAVVNEPGREFSLLLAGGGPTIQAIWHNGSGYLEATWGGEEITEPLDPDVDDYLYGYFFED